MEQIVLVEGLPITWSVEVFNNEDFHYVREYLAQTYDLFSCAVHVDYNPFPVRERMFIGVRSTYMKNELVPFYNSTLLGNNVLTLNKFKNIIDMYDRNEKKIVGYKFFSDESFDIEAAIQLGRIHNGNSKELLEREVLTNLKVRRWFEEHDLLNKWFTPVYKKNYTLPTINDYDGYLIDKTKVRYGCVVLQIQSLRDILNASKNLTGSMNNRNIYSITLNSEVCIKLETIEQIIKYVDNL